MHMQRVSRCASTLWPVTLQTSILGFWSLRMEIPTGIMPIITFGRKVKNNSAETGKRRLGKNEYPRDGYYLMNYYDIQPALNYGYYQPDPENSWEQAYDAPGPKAVRQEIKNIISFWFDKGVDGFRCDLAWSLVKGDDAEFHGVRKLWNEIFSWQAKSIPKRSSCQNGQVR